MKRWEPILPVGDREETTRELTGFDATMDEAEISSAGNGAAPWGGDLTGGPPRLIEDDPDRPADILPDRAQVWPGQPADEEIEVTAQPRERDEIDTADFGWRT